jgi:hypothetical protein
MFYSKGYALNVLECCDRTIRPEKKTLSQSFFQSPEEEAFLGCFAMPERIETFIVAIDDYDIKEMDHKLVSKLKKDEVILRLYSDRVGYSGFAIFNFQKGKVRYQDGAHYDETGDYKFEKYWYKPTWMRIKHDKVDFLNSYPAEDK